MLLIDYWLRCKLLARSLAARARRFLYRLRLCKSYITYDSIFAGKRERVEEQALKLTEGVKTNGVTELLKFYKVNKGR